MLIVDANGGLGNQMYQYALYRALQEKGADVKMSTIHYDCVNKHIPQHGRKFLLEDIFNVKIDHADKKLVYKLGSVGTDYFSRALRKAGIYKKTHINETRYGYPDTEKILAFKNAFLEGYWQKFDYSRDIQHKLRDELTFKSELDGKNAEIAKQIKGCNAVSVHIRRNDYLNIPMYKIQDEKYYSDAIEYIKTKVDSPVFFCFSDDIEWCQQNLSFEKAVFVDWNTGADSYRDMQLMSMCKHNIVANSTFSVWAAWLNAYSDKIVVRPQKYFNDGYTVRDFAWPEEWVIK